MSKKNIKVEVFVPAGVCGCTFSHWIDRVYRIINEYRDLVDVDSYSTNSKRAKELGIDSTCIVADGEVIPLNKLEDIIKSK
ncbi:MAG: hypothetical protein ACTSP4_01460 [Candidatus Hodarchaeales archaeon]